MIKIMLVTALLFSASFAQAGYKMRVKSSEIVHHVSKGFTINYQVPENMVLDIVAGSEGELFQPHVVMESYGGGPAKGMMSIELFNAKGKSVVELSVKGDIGEQIYPDWWNVDYLQSFLLLFMRAGAQDEVSPIYRGTGMVQSQVVMSPASFGKGSKLVMKFSGNLPKSYSQFVINPTCWGPCAAGITSSSLGQVVNSVMNMSGNAEVVIHFEIVEN